MPLNKVHVTVRMHSGFPFFRKSIKSINLLRFLFFFFKKC